MCVCGYVFMCLTDTFASNPQFRVNVVDADEGDENNKGTLIVGLMQKDRRKLKELGMSNLTIGFAIYKVIIESF